MHKFKGPNKAGFEALMKRIGEHVPESCGTKPNKPATSEDIAVARAVRSIAIIVHQFFHEIGN